MNTDRMKKAAQWFYSNVFKDEAIRPRPTPPAQRLPSLLRTARSLETSVNGSWQSRESIFIKQAKLLANYEDDYDVPCNVVRYYPTYQSLTDPELRAYFSWRTKLRRGDLRKTSLSFAFLYIYELINQIGVTDPMDGYGKLTAFRDEYGQLDESILPYLQKWLTDYVIYYRLDANLLAGSKQVIFDRSITVLENIHVQDTAKVIYAVKQLAPKWLERSKFYAERTGDMDTVIVRVLRRVSDHYATRCKKTMVEQYFGETREFQIRLFDTAVFYEQQRGQTFEYAVDEQCVYRCKNGLWTVRKRSCVPGPNAKLNDLLKTIDAVMRQECGYRHAVKCELETKWILKIIHEEITSLLADQKAAEEKKLVIDYSQLARIRRDAADTRDKLTVDEELEEEPPEEVQIPESQPPAPAETGGDSLLDPTEYRLLQSLLYGGSTQWVRTEGHMLSILVDSINEKLYDTFMDSVLDDTPELLEDYIDELKEMVKP